MGLKPGSRFLTGEPIMSATTAEPRRAADLDLQITRDVAADLGCPNSLIEILSVLAGIQRVAIDRARCFDPQARTELKSSLDIYRIAQRIPESRRAEYRDAWLQLADRIREIGTSAPTPTGQHAD